MSLLEPIPLTLGPTPLQPILLSFLAGKIASFWRATSLHTRQNPSPSLSSLLCFCDEGMMFSSSQFDGFVPSQSTQSADAASPNPSKVYLLPAVLAVCRAFRWGLYMQTHLPFLACRVGYLRAWSRSWIFPGPLWLQSWGTQGLVPVTVKQLSGAHQAGDEKSNFSIDGVDVTNVSGVFLGWRCLFFRALGIGSRERPEKEVPFSLGLMMYCSGQSHVAIPRFVSGHAGRDGVRENREGDGCELRFGWWDRTSRMQKMVW